MTNVLTAVENTFDEWGDNPTVIFTLNIRRKPLYYIVNLIIPCFLLSLIAVATFVLLPCNADRLNIGTCIFVVINITIVDYKKIENKNHTLVC